VRSVPAIAADGSIYAGTDENRGTVWRLRDDGDRATVLAQGVINTTVPENYNGGPRYDTNASPAIDATRGIVYFPSDDGMLHAFAASDLKHLWAGTVGTPDTDPTTSDNEKSAEDSAPAVAPDGTVVIGSEDGNVYAFNPDGTQKWMQTPCAGSLVESPPIISSSGIVVTGTSCGLFAYRLSSGAPLWSTDASRDVEFSPIIGPDGSIYYPIDAYDSTPNPVAEVAALKGDIGLP
jgi:outer membrane protein assembly factor BamB